MTNTRTKVENHPSEYLDFDDEVFLPDGALKCSQPSVSEDEMSFRTCDQTIISRKDENKTPVPEFIAGLHDPPEFGEPPNSPNKSTGESVVQSVVAPSEPVSGEGFTTMVMVSLSPHTKL